MKKKMKKKSMMKEQMKKKRMMKKPMMDETEMLMQDAKNPKKKKRALRKLYKTPSG